MFRKFFSAFAVAAMCAVGLVACNDNNVPAPVSQDFSAQSFLADSEGLDGSEIFDDAEPGARIAAIDTGMQVKYRILVTSKCVSGTGSAGFKYSESNISSPVLSGTAISTAAGFKSFSVSNAKLNVEQKKTFDKSKTYTIYMMSAASVKGIPAVKNTAGAITTPAVPSVPAQFKRLVVLTPNPPAQKALNAAGTMRVGRPITTAVTTLACPN